MMDGLQKIASTGPALLVPAAWVTAAFTIAGSWTQQPLAIAHGIMAGFLVFFIYVGWHRLETDPVMRSWRAIIAAGIPATLAGLVGFLVGDSTVLFLISLYYWLLAPAIGLIYTGIHERAFRRTWLLAGTVALTGKAITTLSLLIGQGGLILGIAVAGTGQTIGIIRAVTMDTEA